MLMLNALQLCKATGRSEFKDLKAMAAEAERKRKSATRAC